MSAAGLLADLRARGVTLAADGGRLRVDGPEDVLSDDVVRALAGVKAELLDLLAAEDISDQAPEQDPDEAALAELAQWLAEGVLDGVQVPVVFRPGHAILPGRLTEVVATMLAIAASGGVGSGVARLHALELARTLRGHLAAQPA